ncbi:MAG TPA: tetratricopeptide repeat protein, partial [Longimicrobiales bacterium]|nr:tetratricopeptide repeat protein [Longimicrobiales bacterium]
AAQQSRAVLGTVEFPNSGAEAAQDPFVRGVLLLHSFEYEEAAAAFREAQERDPGFALAYWGEAMTYNHPIWMEQDRAAALDALDRLAPSPEARLAEASGEGEKDWLRAVHVLYGVGEEARELGVGPGADGSPAPKEARDDAYRDFMARMHEKHRGDDEWATFYALSILGSAHEGRDFRTYMRAAAVAEEVFDRNPDHPGAAHYVIHSFDDPIHAPLGLPAARAYSEIAPGAAHAQHMTSHIFVAMGMWEDVVEANEVARDVQNAGEREAGRPPVLCGHYTFWLEYGYLQRGRHDAAAEVMERCHGQVAGGVRSRGRVGYFVEMRSRYLLDTETWSDVERWPLDLSGAAPGLRAHDRWLRGFAAARRGRVAEARRHLDAMEATLRGTGGGHPDLAIMADQLRGAVAVADGRTGDALPLLRAAAEAEAGLPFQFGPPAIPKPTFELLGEALLEAGRADEAAEAFATALQRTPRRTASLLGLARAQEAAGRRAEARRTYGELAAIWSAADPGIEVVRT